jgi:glycosyltransferase involved in cell wall biosynthesis
MNSTKFPLISIITVSYNAVSTIEETILSVINQDFESYEYIIVDGGSTDGTIEVIKKYQDKISLWVSEPDKGIYDAMNKGVGLAKGEWVNFMNAGDAFYDLNVFKKIFSIDRESAVIYGDNMLCYDWGKIVLSPDSLHNIRQYMVFGHQTVFMRKKILLKYPFDCSFKIAADYNLFYRIYTEKYLFEYIPQCISLFSAIDGVSSNNPRISFKEYARINGRDKRKNWELLLLLFRLRLYVRGGVLAFLPSRFIEETKKKNILKNKLIKKVVLKE